MRRWSAIGLTMIAAALPGVVRAQVTSQSGISFTGAVTATPLGDTIGMTANANFPGTTTIGAFAFRGGITEGTNLWLLPNDSNEIVKVDTTTGVMTGFPIPGVGTTQGKFVGGVFDGTFIWLIPFNANAVVRVRVSTGATTLFNNWPAGVTVNTGGASFAGGIFDGTYVWLVPHNASKLVRIDPIEPNSTQMHGVDIPGLVAGAEAYWGGIFDGTSLWLVSWNANSLTKVNVATEVVTDVPFAGLTNFTLPDGAFVGGTFDGSRIWLAPYQANRVVSVAIADNAMTGYGTADDATQWPASYTHGPAAFNTAVYDGDDVWLVPFEANNLVKVDAATGVMTGYTNFPDTVDPDDNDKFAGAAFDGTDIFLIPATQSGQTLVTVFATDVPAVTSITRQTPLAADTNANSVVFRVTFNKNVSNVGTTDFTLTATGTAAGTIASVSAATGTTIDVTMNTVAGDGTLRLDLNASGTGIVDDFANPIAAGFTTGQVYTIDNTAPVITGALTAGGTYKTAFSHTITASGAATVFGATGLPAGLGVNTGTGEISGSPTVPGGPTNVSITATDAAGNSDSETLAITIAQATLTVSGITADNKVYDSNTTATLNTGGAALVGVASGDTVNLVTGSAAGAFANKTIGTGKTVTVSGLSISGSESANYTLTQPTTTANITAKNLTVTGVIANNKTYNANAATTLNTAGATLVGVESGDTVTLDASGASAAFADALAGVAKAVNISGLALAGADSGNYTLSQPAATATITPKALTVSGITASNKVYNANTTATLNTGSAALVGVESGDTVTLVTGSAAGAFADKTVGSGKTVTVSGLTLSGAAATNYSLTQPTTTADITAKGLTVSGVTASNKVYDSTTTATVDTGSAALVGVESGDTVSLVTGSAAGAFANKTVGAGKTVTVSGLTLSGADAANYSLTQPTTTADITAKGLTVSGITASNKVYNAATTATLNTGSAALVGVETGDTVVLDTSAAVGAFADAAVGAGKVVAISGLTISGADSGNYALAQPTTTADITAKNLTVTGVTAQNKVYDSTTTATVVTSGATLVGIESGDTVTLVSGGATGAFANKTVGAGKTVTVSGLSLSGASAGNYSLTQPTATADITSAPLTVSGITANNKPYDGATSATLNTGGAALVGVIGGDTVGLDTTSAAGAFASATVGTAKNVTISGLALTGADAGNYALTQPTATADITAANATILLSNLNQTYDGTAKPATATTNPTGLTVALAYDGSGTAPTAAGSYAVVATIVDVNYEGTENETLVIAKAAATVTITNTEQVYDGTPKAVSVATSPVGLTVSTTYDGSATVPSSIGSHPVVVTVIDANYAGSANATLVIEPTSKLANLSTRAFVGAGGDILIPGFVVSGTGTKKLLIRGVGPELATYGVDGVLEAPTLDLYSEDALVESNTGWSTASNAIEIEQTATDVGAFPLTANSADSALLADVGPGAYTVHLQGVGGTTGIGLVEIYDVDSAATARLLNISARALVGTGGEVLIPGFAIDGLGARTFLIRAIGPGLAQFNVEGLLLDPVFTVHAGDSTEVAANDDWGLADNVGEIEAATAQVGAFPLDSGSKDAAGFITLEPGVYTVRVSGVGGLGGVALVEIFEVQ